MPWLVTVEKQSMTEPLKVVAEHYFPKEEEALRFYRANKRNGFPWTVYAYPKFVPDNPGPRVLTREPEDIIGRAVGSEDQQQKQNWYYPLTVCFNRPNKCPECLKAPTCREAEL